MKVLVIVSSRRVIKEAIVAYAIKNTLKRESLYSKRLSLNLSAKPSYSLGNSRENLLGCNMSSISILACDSSSWLSLIFFLFLKGERGVATDCNIEILLFIYVSIPFSFSLSGIL